MRAIRGRPETGNPGSTPAPSPTPLLDALIASEPDLVDRVFDYVVALVPEISTRQSEIKRALREEFACEQAYIRRHDASDRTDLATQILRLFNGRNAREVARVLNIHRATVYRYLKQPGRRR
jgi:transcriptional regulator of acetoin/glycerol metabolism